MSDIRVTFKRASVEASTEVGSFAELAGLIQEESSTLMKIFGDDMETVIQRLGVTLSGAPVAGETPQPSAAAVETEAQRKKREKAEAKALAATAIAPDPVPVPPAAVPPLAPLDTTPNANGVPAFLDRTAPVAPPPPLPTAAAPPPPPPAAAPPPPPPVGVLGPKIVAALDVIKAGKPDGGQALADWLHACGLTIKGSTYDEACRVVLMTADAKLQPIAGQLNVAA